MCVYCICTCFYIHGVCMYECVVMCIYVCMYIMYIYCVMCIDMYANYPRMPGRLLDKKEIFPEQEYFSRIPHCFAITFTSPIFYPQCQVCLVWNLCFADSIVQGVYLGEFQIWSLLRGSLIWCLNQLRCSGGSKLIWWSGVCMQGVQELHLYSYLVWGLYFREIGFGFCINFMV